MYESAELMMSVDDVPLTLPLQKLVAPVAVPSLNSVPPTPVTNGLDAG